ncbi:hypothetical protein [Caldivirga maquilingensis]|uniref:Uncharacterized protein n=1 Tax=Caldivirga maquilingensis (strain ATCC 700844 / DSM 13496 / JCM 10307 / IC-167) TaxID=397948 RepID=A8MD68_CALMQ|nr:hypothetical protein [Caldivirga maquilingensis]ABW01724.1 hypothetical protein Cmaq_0890 [Caldivirga maquilingensis IC-167]
MRLIAVLPLVLGIMLGLVTIAHAQQCLLTLNTTLGYVNVTTNAQSIDIHAWGVVGVTNHTTCSFHYIVFKYSLLGMSSLIYVHTLSNNSGSYVILNSGIGKHVLICLTLNPTVTKNNIIKLTSGGGSITAYCSIVDENSLTQYSLLLAVLIGIALVTVSYFTIRNLLK